MNVGRSARGLLLLVALAAILVACDDFLLRTLMEGEDGSAWAGRLQISPASITIAQAGDITFTAKGGSGSYTYSIVAPVGGSTIVGASGLYTASTTATGTETVRVTDSGGATSDAAVTIIPATGTIPDYAIVSATYPSPPYTAGELFSGSFQIQETSGNPGGSSITARVYLSGNTSPDAGDQVIHSQTLAALAGSGVSGVLSYSGQWPASGGDYYLLIEAAAGDDVDTSDNLVNGGLITVGSAAPPNYDVTALTPAAPITVSPGGAISHSLTFDNVGTGNGTASLYWEVYLDLNGNSTIDAGIDTLLASGIEAAMSTAAAPITHSFGGTWPATAGTCYLIARLAAADDSDPLDDTEVSAAITVQPPDYVIDSVSNLGGATAGGPIAGQFTYRNSAAVGNGSQPVFWKAYYSTLATLDGSSEVLFDSGTAAARNAATAAVPVAFDGTWPSTAGDYYLIVELGASDETDAEEQAYAGPVTLSSAPLPDVTYVVQTVTNTGALTGDAAISGEFTYRNTGTAAGTQTIYWSAYYSTASTLNGSSEVLIATGTASALLAGAISAPVPFSGGTWPAAGGSFYLIVKVGASDSATTDEGPSGLTAVSPVDPPDYDVTSLTPAVAITVSAGAAVGQTVTFDNIGAGDGTVAVTWEVYLDLNGNSTIESGTDLLLSAGVEAAMSTAAAPVTRAVTGTWPATAGTYRLIARLTASDDAVAGNDLEVSAAITVQPPDYVIDAVSNLGGTTAGAAISGQFTYRNSAAVGNGSQPVFWSVYTSTLATLNGTDEVLIDSGTAPALGAASVPTAVSFSGTWPSTAGSYYLIASLSASDEVNTANNATHSAALAITAPPPPDIDYRIVGVINTGGTTAGTALSGTFTFANQGTSAGTQQVPWTVYLSADAVLDGGDPVADADFAAPLGAGATSAAIPFTGTWPAGAGTWYLIAGVASLEDVVPLNNSGSSGAIAVSPSGGADIDYDVLTVTNTGGVVAGGALAGEFTVRNIGTVAGAQQVLWAAYVSADAVLGGGDELVDSGTISPLAAGATDGPIAFSGTWPLTGPRTLIVQVTAFDDVALGNNVEASASIALSVPQVDYQVTSVSNTGGTTAGGALSATFTASNNGPSNGTRTLFWQAYLSADAALDASDTVVQTGSMAPLAGWGSVGPVAIAGTWPLTPGWYYIIVRLIAEDDVNAGNDTMATGAAIEATAPNVDYQVNYVNNVGPSRTTAVLHGEFAVQNIGAVDGASPVQWTAYLSANTTIEPGTDIVLDAGTIAGLTASTTATIHFYDTWPSLPGTWYLVVSASAADDVASGNDVLSSAAVTLTNPSVDYDMLSVSYGGGYTLPTGAFDGTFSFTNYGPDDGSQQVGYTVYASADATLDAADPVVAAGSTSALDAGATSSAIPFSGQWPLAFGAYYLFVRLSSTEDAVPANDFERTAAGTSVGILVEGEPNDDCVTFVDADDLLDTPTTGVRLAPGMSLQVTGTMTPSDMDDVFMINTGTAARVRTVWQISIANQDMGIYYYDPAGTILGGSGLIGNPFTEYSNEWIVDAPNATRYVDLYNYSTKNLGAYTCIITAY